VKKMCRYLPLLSMPLLFAQFAAAQAGVDFNVGLGTAHAKSSGEVFETFGDGVLYRTPKLRGPFLGFGGNVMLTKQFGFGAAINFQPHKPDYAGLKARTMFWDINGIYQPFAAKRAALQLQGGIGAANMKFYYAQTGCSGFGGCSTQTQLVDRSNHFQLHGGAGVQVYLTDHVFVRPQIDIRYVPNFFQFGQNLIPSATVWVGYSLGER